MERFLILLLLTLALARASLNERGLLLNLDNGEMCFNSLQCKSSCCHRTSGLSVFRCADKAAENQECSRTTLYGTYYKCPCENGLICDVDRTIVGSIMNTDFGICRDPSNSISSE